MANTRKRTMRTGRQWQVQPKLEESAFARFPELPPVVLQLLANRGLKIQEGHEGIDEFLNPDFGTDLHDPFLFRDAAKAVSRIFEAVNAREKIVIYGDYDADGVCATSILFETLTALGSSPRVYIPYRETEGYGMNVAAVNLLADEGTKLIITVDCGSANAREAAVLKERGVDLIITDHHEQPLKIPESYALLNPMFEAETYPFRRLCGTGVAFKLAQGLIARHRELGNVTLEPGFEKWLLDLVAIGTIADMMPLLGENRTLVKYGLIVLQKTRRLGLQKLLASGNGKQKSQPVDERHVGFFIAPRINAAGRLNHANTAYELLTTTDANHAEALATELDGANKERQRLTEDIQQLALASVGTPDNQPLLAAVGKGWPTGLLGLVSGRLTDQFFRPSLVISDFHDELIGSGRSIPDFDITHALQQCDEFLSRYGGHAQACGFTLKNRESLEPFISRMTELAADVLKGKELVPTIRIDSEITLDEVNWNLYEYLEQFAPFGESNPKPKFLLKDLEIVEAKAMGQDNQHLRLSVRQGSGAPRKVVAFFVDENHLTLQPADRIDAVIEIDVNEWNGNRELQMKVVDMIKSQQ